MNIVDVKNPRHAAGDTIIADIKWADEEGYYPFAASPNDVMEYGRQLYRELVEGNYGEVAPYSDASIRQDLLAANKFQLAQLIAEADAIIRPLSEEREAGIASDLDNTQWKNWVVYRKELRNLNTENEQIDWPMKPQ